jgi:DNA-3-methyladenine glycosylase
MPVLPGCGPPFPRDSLEGDTVAAAQGLLGARLVRIDAGGVRVARIVEAEAYLEGDLASHARRGRTQRNAAMFGPAGHAYVYLVYGVYECLNVVTEGDGRAAAVLIRAVVPVTGEEIMQGARAGWRERREERRSLRATPGPAPVPAPAVPRPTATVPPVRLAAGPGLVCVAMSVGLEDDGLDLCDPASSLHLRQPPAAEAPPRIVAGPRVGIGYAPEPWRSMPLRFRAVAGGAE